MVSIDVTRIERGIEVCGRDGARLGTVNHICVDAAQDEPGTVVTSGYFRVGLDRAEEHEIQELHVPFSAVTSHIPGDSVRLDFSFQPQSTCYRSLPRVFEW